MGTLTEGWSVAYNVVAGAGSVDTLKIALSTALGGTLILLPLQTADVRTPASTALQLVRALLNEGTPATSPQNGTPP